MGAEIKADQFPKVSVTNDLTVTLSFTDKRDGGRVSAELEPSAARSLLHALLMRFDPSIEQLGVVLARHGLVVTNDDALQKRFGLIDSIPDTGRGIYISRNPDGGWQFGRGVEGCVYWEPADAADLLDLGIKIGDLEKITPGKTYRFGFVGGMREA